VTAGHCYNGQESSPAEACSNYSWVFGYEMTSESSDPTKKIPSQNVYRCKQVISSELNETLDFTVVKLDRPVVGREPLKFRTTGKIPSSTSLVVIGHPSGLPTKISDGGKVTRNTETTRFSTNLDTFQGNSGSAVFDTKTGSIEGILIQGKSDYTRSNPLDPKSCIVVNKCDENGNNCSAGVQSGPIQFGEVVFRIGSINSQLSNAIKGK
jgi:V8-like Glu-specific endopeptidase